ncbi:MAG: hypothetical protein JNK94_01175 [Hyphomonadaceae bacterium]|nr:hypothetical protein [Hyphomonadaceae bacterium]MBX3510598.1 hypothetical protein [Hyphomonadaceae bacterium]
MIGLFFSQLILFTVAGGLGFALGWRLYVLAHDARLKADREEIERLRGALAEAQVRRARIT